MKQLSTQVSVLEGLAPNMIGRFPDEKPFEHPGVHQVACPDWPQRIISLDKARKQENTTTDNKYEISCTLT